MTAHCTAFKRDEVAIAVTEQTPKFHEITGK
jgi:hypothetical protein